MNSEQDPFYRFISVASDGRTYLNLIYLVLMLPLGIIYFTIVVTGFSLSLGLILVIIGIVVAVLFLVLVRGISFVHLSFASALLGFELPPEDEPQATTDGLLEKLKRILTDAKTYTSMIYMLIELPLGIIYFTLIITFLSISVSFSVTPILWLLAEEESWAIWDNDWLWQVNFGETLLLMLGGVCLFFVTLHLGNLLAKVEQFLCKNLLTRL